jgi:hypothetical protein
VYDAEDLAFGHSGLDPLGHRFDSNVAQLRRLFQGIDLFIALDQTHRNEFLGDEDKLRLRQPGREEIPVIFRNRSVGVVLDDAHPALIIAAVFNRSHDRREYAGIADDDLPHRGACQHGAGKGMARPENDTGIALLWEKTIVGHLRLAHHVRDITEVEPQSPVGRRTADDQKAIEPQLAHHCADVLVPPLIFRFGEPWIRKALV